MPKSTVDEAGAGEWYVLINDDGSAEARLFAAEAQSASFRKAALSMDSFFSIIPLTEMR